MPEWRVFRGSVVTEHWGKAHYSNYSDSRFGWRPVLAVNDPSALGADGLRAITIDLNGSNLGADSSITTLKIVAAGDSYTAPSSEGIIKPADQQLTAWNTNASGTGTSYAPGERVPSSVTALYAQWKNVSVGDSHYVTVTGGSGGGRYYLAGSSVTITADAPPVGRYFRDWTLSGLSGVDTTQNPLTFTMPGGPVTAVANYQEPTNEVTNAEGLAWWLRSTTAQTINVSADVTLPITGETLVLGAGHTLHIAPGKTVTLQGDYRINIGKLEEDAKTLRVTGGGRLVLNRSDGSTLWGDYGTLALDNITVDVTTPGSEVGGGIDLRHLIVGDGATVNLDAPNAREPLRMEIAAGSVVIENGGTINVKNFSLQGIDLNGHMTVKQGGTLRFSVDNRDAIEVRSGATLKIEDGAILEAVEGSRILFETDAIVENMGGLFGDQGHLFDTDAPVVVGGESVAAADNALTAGSYAWDGTRFVKAESPPPEITTAQALIDALQSTTAQTIYVTADITIPNDPEGSVVLGASHILNIASGITVTSEDHFRNDESTPLDLTINGGGTLLFQDQVIKVVGTLTVENATLALDTGGIEWISTLYTVNVKNGGTIDIRDALRTGVRLYGVMTIADGGTVKMGPADALNPRNAIALYDKDQSMIVVRSGGMLENYGKSYIDAPFDENGSIVLEAGALIKNLGNTLQDLDSTINTIETIVVSPIDEWVEDDKLTAGSYVWNGSVFRKATGRTSITTEEALTAMLQSTTAQTIYVTADITLDIPSTHIMLGADHTLHIALGKTVTLEGAGGLYFGEWLSTGKTLHVNGGGTLVLRRTNGSALVGVGGTLNLENVIVDVTTRPDNDNNTGEGGINVRDVTVGIGATIYLNAPDVQKLVRVDNHIGTLTIENGGAIRVQNFTDEAIDIVGTMTIEQGGRFTVSGGSGSTIWIKSGGTLQLADGASLDIEHGSRIKFSSGAKVVNMGGKLRDQGKGFDTDAQVTVGDENTAAADNALTTGEYYWNGWLFEKRYYTVTYEVDGGSAPAPIQAPVQKGDMFVVAPYSGTKEGYTFLGWKANYSTNYDAGDVCRVDTALGIFSSITMRAQWEANPTLVIDTADELMDFAANVNSGETYRGQTVALGDNINLSGKTWVPIGSGSDEYGSKYTFEGTFDGRGYTISTLTIDSPSSAHVQGLFGRLDYPGTVKNFTLVSVAIDVTGAFNDSSNRYAHRDHAVGGVVAYNGSGALVQNVTVSGSIGGIVAVGGIVGYNSGTIEDCTNNAEIIGSVYAVGGLVGHNDSGRIYSASNNGGVSSQSHVQPANDAVASALEQGTGGIVGYNSDGTLRNVSNTGDLIQMNTGGGDRYNIGGIVGCNETENYANPASVVNAYNSASVSGQYNVGGLIGQNGGILRNAYNTGSVSAAAAAEVGGVVGEQERGFAELSNAYYAAIGSLQAVGAGESGENVGAFTLATGVLHDPATQNVNGQTVSTLLRALEIGAGVHNYSDTSSAERAKDWTVAGVLPVFGEDSAEPIKPAPIYSVSFETNGGGHENTVDTNVSGKLSTLPTPTKRYFDFVEWQLENGLTVTTDTIFRESRTTVYAVWKSNLDVDGTPGIGISDLIEIVKEGTYNMTVPEGESHPADLNGDGKVNFADLALARNSQHFGA